jgi:hypothetical protein
MATLSGSTPSRRLLERQLNSAVKSSILKHFCRINNAASSLELQGCADPPVSGSKFLEPGSFSRAAAATSNHNP